MYKYLVYTNPVVGTRRIYLKGIVFGVAIWTTDLQEARVYHYQTEADRVSKQFTALVEIVKEIQ